MQPDIQRPQFNQPSTRPQFEVPSEPSAPVPPPPPVQPPRKSHRGLWEVLVVVLLVAAGIGGYLYGQNKTTTPEPKTSTVNTPTETTPTVHYVQSVGYPFDLGAKTQIVTKLGVPQAVQAVRISSTGGDPGLTDIFTDKSNDEMARFAFGNPESQDDNGGGTSSLSILAVSKSWLAAKGSSADVTLKNYIDANPLQTPTDKQKFVSDLKTTTTSCVSDSAKGFSTIDKALNICYSVDPGKEAYSPQLILKGYGEVEKQPLILAGMVSVYDSTNYGDQAAQQKVISDAKSGKLPAKTKAYVDAFVAALKQSTVSASPNPAKQ